MSRRTTPGFTIVELLIVIVVIGILAAIVIVAYNGVQAGARDTIRKNDLANLKSLIVQYSLDKGDYAQLGCGSGAAGTGNGWLAADYDGTGPVVSVNACLKNAGLLPQPIIDPSGTLSCNGANIKCHAYMKASCASGTYLFANLEAEPHPADATENACYPAWASSYGMNYVLKVS